jgi:hypothetical protein
MPPSASALFTSKQSYFASSRAPRYSLLFALPLLLVYELLAAALSGPSAASQVRNGADVLLKQLAGFAMGARGPLVLVAAIIGLCIWIAWRDVRRSGGVRPPIFAGMMLESTLLAVAFGIVIGTITARLLGTLDLLMIPGPQQEGGIASLGWSTRLMLSLGAGLYEELLFRVLLVGALAAGAQKLMRLSRRAAGILAAVVGALVFSAFHYVGAYGDPFELQSFTFRAISGLAFSGMYLLRGFGITAWTHALYDVFLLVL